MLIQIILFLFLGVLAGTITGLIPGIHINLIGSFIVAASVSLFFSINPIYLIVFITAMAIAHTFLDFIPSIFLGCPDTDTELSVLPGHELLKQGLGYEAIILTAYGSLAAIFLLILIAFPSIILISKTYSTIIKLIPYILILISIFLIYQEQNKISALVVFFLSGILGLCVLNLNFKEPLLPMLTGLFGSSMLLMSIKQKPKIPKQKILKTIKKKNLLRPLAGALIASPFCSFLPGLGSGQAAIVGNTITEKFPFITKNLEPKTNQKRFLILLGATNTLVMGFSFISLYIISRTRTGAAVAIENLLGNISFKPNLLILILTIILFSGIISFFLTKYLAEFFSKKINKINYSILSLITLIVLVIIIFIFSGFYGFLIFAISTATGIYGISLKVRRTNLMGCLLIPTIFFYLF